MSAKCRGHVLLIDDSIEVVAVEVLEAVVCVLLFDWAMVPDVTSIHSRDSTCKQQRDAMRQEVEAGGCCGKRQATVMHAPHTWAVVHLGEASNRRQRFLTGRPTDLVAKDIQEDPRYLFHNVVYFGTAHVKLLREVVVRRSGGQSLQEQRKFIFCGNRSEGHRLTA